MRPDPTWNCQEASGIADPATHPDGCAPNNNKGCPICIPGASSPVGVFGDPINAASGNKYEIRTEYRGSGPFPLEFTWTYNSSGGPNTDRLSDTTLGFNRTDNYRRRVVAYDYGTSRAAYVARPDGNTPRFDLSGSNWVSATEMDGILTSTIDANGAITGWTYRNERNETESYDASGRLQSIKDAAGYVQTLSYDTSGRVSVVTDMEGRALIFSYNTSNRLIALGLPDGGVIQFAYDAAGNLQTVTYPDVKTRGYVYNESAYTAGANLPHALTGEVDENGTRVSTTTYDTSGRATGTFLASNVDAYSATYTLATDGTYEAAASITTPLGLTRSVSFQMTSGRVVPQSASESCTGCVTRTTAFGHYTSGRVSSVTNASGGITNFTVDANGLETERVEAANDTTGNKRTIQTDWDISLRQPTERRTYDAAGTPVARQTWAYNSRGQVLTASRIDPTTAATKTTTTTYCEQSDVTAGTCPLVGLVRSVDGPRTDASDVSSYTYYASDDASCATAPTTCPHRAGDLWKVTNALGQVTETLAYDGAGRVLSVKDPNGVVTDMVYSARGWLTARKVRGANNAVETDDAITGIDYWPTGLVKQVTQPDGSYTAYGYDGAHRLTDVSDNAGNSIHYTLDNAGNRTAEDTKDPSSTLTRTLSRVYNQLGQLQSQRDAALHATTFTYDANGNSDLVTDPASHITDSDYDPLNRLSHSLQDVGGIAASTQFQYDALDNLTQVTDPKGLVTGYGYDGLGNLTSLSSPDTGATSYTYDSAGNRKTQTDARAKVTTYSYDALNRLTAQTYGTTSLNVTSTYDTVNAVCGSGETFAVGRLTKLTMGNGNSTSTATTGSAIRCARSRRSTARSLPCATATTWRDD